MTSFKIVRKFALYCKDPDCKDNNEGLVALADIKDALQKARRAHEAFHERFNMAADAVINKHRRQQWIEKKTFSESTCACPCAVHVDVVIECVEEKRDQIVIIPPAIAGLPPQLHMCEPCATYWRERIQTLLNKVEIAGA